VAIPEESINGVRRRSNSVDPAQHLSVEARGSDGVGLVSLANRFASRRSRRPPRNNGNDGENIMNLRELFYDNLDRSGRWQCEVVTITAQKEQ
jgi:hypothetical protein